jgi:hypothetical protein
MNMSLSEHSANGECIQFRIASPGNFWTGSKNKLFIGVLSGVAMSALIGLIGIIFLLSGFLNVAKITDVGFNLVSLTQIHTLPLLNTIPSGWAYMIVGLIFLLIAGAMYRGRRVTYLNEAR